MLLVHSTEYDIISELVFEGIEFEEDMLGIGDMVTSERTCIELKRGKYNNGVYSHDFVASIKDQRLKIQCQNMKNNYDRRIMIIEDFSNLQQDFTVESDSIIKSMATIATHYGISIIPTESMDETVKVIMHILAIDAKDGYYCPYNKHPKAKTEKENQIYFLTGLLNIKVKKATQLLDELKTPYNVIKAIVNSTYIIPKRGKNKKLVGIFTKMKGFGPKFVDKNQTMLTVEAT